MARKRRTVIAGHAPTRQASGYSDAGASWTRRALKGFRATSGSAARDIDDNNYTLRQRSRALYMGSPVATSAIRTSRTNIVGTGLVPRPRIDAAALGLSEAQADEWQDKARREFALWAGDRRACDALGLSDFAELQQLVCQSWLVSGDVFAVVKRAKPSLLRPYTLRLHVVEADRVSTPTSYAHPMAGAWTTGKNPDNGNTIYDGVEVSPSGAVVAYHIRNGYPNEYTAEAARWVRVLASGNKSGLPNVLHVMEAERPDQYRGVSILAQAIEPLKQLGRYTNAELDAAVIQSCLTAFITTEVPAENPFNEVGGGPGDEELSDDENEYELGPGTINYLLPGEGVQSVAPTHPEGGFDAFVGSICTQVGAAVEIPRDLLLKEFNSSYSASRAALLEAWKSFRMRRQWLVNDFCKPVWELFLTEAVSNGRIAAPGFFTDPARHAAYLGCEWVGPSQGQIDPTKEINAELTAIQAGITTHEAAAIRLNGSDWDDNIRRLRRESEAMGEIAGGGEDGAVQGQG